MKPLVKFFEFMQFLFDSCPPPNQALFINQTYFSSYRSQNQYSFVLFWDKTILVAKSERKQMILLTVWWKLPGSQKASFTGVGSKPVFPIGSNVHPFCYADSRALFPGVPIWRDLGDGQGRSTLRWCSWYTCLEGDGGPTVPPLICRKQVHSVWWMLYLSHNEECFKLGQS